MSMSDDVRTDDVRAEDTFVERFRHSEFLYSRNGQYKTVELNFYQKEHVEKFPTINLLEIDCNKVKLHDEFKVHYENGPCDISIKNIAACIVKGRHLKWNIYLQIMSVGLSDLTRRVFVTIMNLTKEKNKELNFFVDWILININCDLKLPLNKIIYFDDMIIRFDRDDKVDYREKTRCFVNAYVLKAKSCCLLNKIYSWYLLKLIVFLL